MSLKLYVTLIALLLRRAPLLHRGTLDKFPRLVMSCVFVALQRNRPSNCAGPCTQHVLTSQLDPGDLITLQNNVLDTGPEADLSAQCSEVGSEGL